jgi:monovalent cation:H+ antiporter-2, CPA2 family
VLFFVSVGMLFDPLILFREPFAVLATVLIIVFGKSVAAYFIVRLFGYPKSHALTISASLAQIGEFSFILAGLGVTLSLLPERARDLILAGAIISILLNPLLFAWLDRTLPKPKPAEPADIPRPGGVPEPDRATSEPLPPTRLSNHVVLVGYGRVGRIVADGLRQSGAPLLLIEAIRPEAVLARDAGIEAIHGNAADPEVLAAANLARARCLIVAIPDAFEGGQIVAAGSAVHTRPPTIARSHSDEESEHLKKHGANIVIMGEQEIATAMLANLSNTAI